jgi:hypothetical protein
MVNRLCVKMSQPILGKVGGGKNSPLLNSEALVEERLLDEVT